MRLYTLVAIALLVPSLARAAEPAGSAAGLKIFPQDTLFYASIPDADVLRSQWRQSSLGALQEDPRFEEFVEDIRLKLETFSASLEQQLGIEPIELWEQIEGGISVGLVRSEEGPLALLAVADLKGGEQEAARLVQQIEERLRGRGAEQMVVEAQNRKFTSWTTTLHGQRQSFSYAQQDGQLILGSALPAVLEAVSRAEDPEAKTLADSQSYDYVMQQLDSGAGPPAMRWFVDPVGLVDAAVSANLQGNPQLPMLRGFIPLAGLDQLKGVGGTADLASGQFDSVTRTFGYVQQPTRGLLRALELPASRQEPPGWVSEDVSLYAQVNWSAPQMYDAVGNFFDSFQGAGAFDQALGAISVGKTDVRLKDDIVDQLTGPLHIVAKTPEQAEDLFSQPTLFAIQVRNPERMAQTLGALAASSSATSSELGGTQVHELTVEYPLTGQTLSLGAAVSSGALMVSSNAEFLREVVSTGEAQRPLNQSPEYQRVAAQFPSRTSMISFQRQDNRLETFYELLRSGALQGMPTMGIDFTALPPFEAMRPYLQSSGSYVEPAENGFRMVQFAFPPRE